MKQTKHEPKALMTVRFQKEARSLLLKRKRQGRLLDIAAAKGMELEPVGWMAG